jgi:cell division protein FtsW
MQTKNQPTVPLFLTTVLFLIIIGLIFIYSSSSIFALEKFGSAQYFVKKQVIGLILGFCGFCFFSALPIKYLKKLSPFLFFGALLITGMTLLPKLAVKIHGSSRWVSAWFITFQPSELLKITFIPYIAYFLEKKKFKLSSLSQGYFPFLIIVGMTAGILLLQPDFGQAVTLSTTALLLFFVVHTNMRHIMYTVIPLIPVTGLLILLKPYRFKRILTFLDPWSDPQGAGFQIIQSLIAIGSGNITGVGLAQSRQKFFYLPMQHTDFIFSIIAEEAGFIGASAIIGLYALFLYLGVRIAWYLKNTFCMLTVLGFTILISLQAIINIFVATGLVPTKGIGLPFISYGNSALIAHLCMVGIIIACTKEERE